MTMNNTLHDPDNELIFDIGECPIIPKKYQHVNKYFIIDHQRKMRITAKMLQLL